MNLTSSTRPAGALAEIIRDALRFWETGRLGYNTALLVVTVAWIDGTWPRFAPAFTPRGGLLLLALAAVANVLYCAAYPVDLVLQHTGLRQPWRRWRWLLWAAGTLFALLLACLWIGAVIYPHVEEAARPLW